jgi:amino acid transporter
MIVNLRGARDVGRSSKLCTIFVLSAFGLVVGTWLIASSSTKNVVGLISHDLSSGHAGALLVALSTLVFNYSGYDNISTYAAEVDQPQRNYPRAIAIALLVVLLAYLLPVVAGIGVTTDPAVWNAGWPVIAELLGGRWLGALIATAGLVSSWALFNAQLLYVSRLPFVLAQDGWLPKIFANVSPKGAVPKEAIIFFCAITALLASLTFVGLAVIQCLLYAGALTLEFLALIILRLRRVEAPGSFRIPGGWWGLAYVYVTPFGVTLLVLKATLRDWRSFPGSLLLVGLSLVTGIALFFLRRPKASVQRIVSLIANASPEMPESRSSGEQTLDV